VKDLLSPVVVKVRAVFFESFYIMSF